MNEDRIIQEYIIPKKTVTYLEHGAAPYGHIDALTDKEMEECDRFVEQITQDMTTSYEFQYEVVDRILLPPYHEMDPVVFNTTDCVILFIVAT